MNARPILHQLRRLPLAGLAALALTAAPALAAEPHATSRDFRGVVELFTSQGCSTCPPADAVLAALSDRADIVALTFNVDYWDYIGWKDQLATRQNTERQKAYAKAFRTSSVYTPQIVVNGDGDFVGTHQAEIAAALDTRPLNAAPAAAGLIEMQVEGDTLIVSAHVERPDRDNPPVLALAIYQDRIETPVLKGENRGHNLVNRHAVRDFRVLGSVSPGKPLRIELPISMVTEGLGARIGCAAMLQNVDHGGKPGRILAAAQLEFAAD